MKKVCTTVAFSLVTLLRSSINQAKEKSIRNFNVQLTLVMFSAFLFASPLSAEQNNSLVVKAKVGLAHASNKCDDSLWSHVYKPERLIINNQCIEVTGTIVDATHGRRSDGVRHEPDGDTHGWLKLDSQFKNLMNAGNKSNEEGNLVFEIVCEFSVTQQDAKSSCKGYKSSIKIPPVGSHVRMVGTYVQDTNHAKWMEIHPVTSITVIP